MSGRSVALPGAGAKTPANGPRMQFSHSQWSWFRNRHEEYRIRKAASYAGVQHVHRDGDLRVLVLEVEVVDLSFIATTLSARKGHVLSSPNPRSCSSCRPSACAGGRNRLRR